MKENISTGEIQMLVVPKTWGNYITLQHDVFDMAESQVQTVNQINKKEEKEV